MSCGICWDAVSVIQMSCSCQFWTNCLKDWVLLQISDLKFQAKKVIICPNMQCRKEYEIDDILQYFEGESFNLISDALFKSYLRKTKDIRPCPNPQCSYAGMINLEERCHENLICDVCQTSWRDPYSYTLDEKIKKAITSFRSVIFEASSCMYEELLTSNCPTCSIPILKNGGCKHMTCKKCSHEFCWHCMQPYFSHKNDFCAASIASRTLIILIFMIHVLALTGVGIIIKDWFVQAFWLLIKIMFFDAAGFLNFLAMDNLRHRYFTVYARYDWKYKMKYSILPFFMAVSLLSGYIAYLIYFDVFASCLTAYGLQAFGAMCVGAYFEFFENWFRLTY